MKTPVSLLLVLACCIKGCLTQECSRNAPAGETDCSPLESAICFVDRGSSSDPEPIPDSSPNTRSCYRTCIQANDPFPPRCLVDRIPFENNRLVRVRGPRNRTVFTTFRLFSPNFRKGNPYLNNVDCRYHVLCEDEIPDSIISINLQQHSLETELPCNGGDECVDSLKMRLPYGGSCTTCDRLPISCQEVGTGFGVSELLHFDGNRSLLLEFQSNREERFTGFQFLVTCVSEAYFEPPGCSTPDSVPGSLGRRDTSTQDMMGKVFPRARRSASRVVYIVVPASAAVSYVDYTVRVFRGDEWLYKFLNIRIFKVFNFAEGHQIFYQTGPPGRTFPGYGILCIGWGVIHYIQTGINSELLPSPAETAIILNLQRRLVLAVDEPDIDISDALDGPDVPGITKPPSFTRQELYVMAEQARTYDNACNGILRATCCAYQQQFFPQGPEPDCFVGLP